MADPETDKIAPTVTDAARYMLEEIEAADLDPEELEEQGEAPPDDYYADAPPLDPGDLPPPPASGKGRGPTKKARDAMDLWPMMANEAGTLFVWNGRYWKPHNKHEILALAFKCGGTTSSQRREMHDYWLAATLKSGHKWGRVSPGEIPFENGVLDLESLTLRPHVPEDYLERVVPHAWEGAAECPHWLAHLEEWFGSLEDDRVAALQEFFGYALGSHAKYKKALMIYGPSNTGKSRVIDCLVRLVGDENKCSIDLESLDDPTLRTPIIGKALNVIAELPDGALIKDGAFKTMVSTEEPIQINEKYKSVITYTPTAKFAIATNTLPAISDRSEATFNRLLIITMDRVFRRGEGAVSALSFDEEVATEIAGILVWAVEGARRLYRSEGEFTAPASSLETIANYRLEQNPVEQFVDERCRRIEAEEGAPRRGTSTEAFLRAFNAWNEGGRKWSKTRLSRTLKTMGIEVEPVKVRGRSRRVVLGIELIPDEEFAARIDVENGEGYEVPDGARDEVPVEGGPAGEEPPTPEAAPGPGPDEAPF